MLLKHSFFTVFQHFAFVIEKKCGEVYSDLWSHFKEDLFYKYADDLWYKYNDFYTILDEKIKNSVCLDGGFGSGRAIYSMIKAGAKKVYGIDISAKNYNTASKNLSAYSEKIQLNVGSVLELPYEDNFFDVVHSYGVLHHTKNPYRGFTEFIRVLKPGGTFLLYVYNRGGFFNNTLNMIRFFSTKSIPPFKISEKIIRFIFGEDENHYWYSLLDGLYTPYRFTFYDFEIRKWFEKNGIKDINRFYCKWFYNKWYQFFSGRDKGGLIYIGIKK